MKLRKDKKEEIKKEAVDPTPKEKVEDKPEIEVTPRCTMEVVPNEETGGVDIVYSKHCSGGTVREIAGKIALDGVRFRPRPEEKPEEKPVENPISEKTKEEIKKVADEKSVLTTKEDVKKEFKEKVSACESGKSESCKKTESES